MDIKYPIAVPAVEVMVVVTKHLKAGRLPRKLNLGDELLIDKQIQVAVHRGQIQVRNRPLSIHQNLLRQQRTCGSRDRLGDGTALLGGAGHN